MPTILQRCRAYFFPYSSNFPSPTSSFPPPNLSKYVPWEKPNREKDDNTIIGTPIFALLELIFFFKFQANSFKCKCFEDTILIREMKSP